MNMRIAGLGHVPEACSCETDNDTSGSITTGVL
jgi:hypothetical protein